MEHLLIGKLDFAEVIPTCIIVQADVGDDESLVIDVLRIALNVNPHDASMNWI